MQTPSSSYHAIPTGQLVQSIPNGQIVQTSYIQQPSIVLSSPGGAYASPLRAQPVYQTAGPVYVQNVQPVLSSSGSVVYRQHPQATSGNGMKDAAVDTVLPGVGILGEGVKTGVGSLTGGLMTGVNSIKNGVMGGAETVANGVGVNTGGRVKGHQQFFRPEHSHRSHGIGTGVAEIGSGILSLPVGLVATSLNAVAKLGGAAIGTGLALGGTAIGVGVDIVGNTAGVLGNTFRQIGHGLADITHIHRKH